MAYISKAMRQKLANDAYEDRHPERGAQRIAYRKVAEQALAETQAKYPVLTADNFQEANDYRERRIAELLGGQNG
jgi:hypothetical protein